MEYNVKLINVYTSLRHSDLLHGVINKESIAYFQNTLNKSIPCTSTERLVFQTHRKLLKVSVQDSISIITNTKLWHLCLCAPIPILRSLLNIPESIDIVYNKSVGYCITSRLSTIEEFPVLNNQSVATTQVTQNGISNDWINAAKKQPLEYEAPVKRRDPRHPNQHKSSLQQPVKILTRASTPPASQQVAPSTEQSKETLDDAIKKLKEMPSQNWADMEDDIEPIA